MRTTPEVHLFDFRRKSGRDDVNAEPSVTYMIDRHRHLRCDGRRYSQNIHAAYQVHPGGAFRESGHESERLKRMVPELRVELRSHGI